MVKDTIKEDYISQENLSSKSKKWQKELEIYSKKRFKFVSSSSALLIMDMQDFFLNEESHAFIPSSEAIIPNIRALIDRYRKNDLTVIFTKHSLLKNEEPGIMGRWWGDVIREEDVLSNIATSLKPLDSETVIRKTRYSAFHGTDLDILLKKDKVGRIVITGVMTHLCCESTARDAFMNDYEVFFVVDATATQNEELHLSTLKTLSHGFAVPITTEEILKENEGIQS